MDLKTIVEDYDLIKLIYSITKRGSRLYTKEII